MIATSNIYLYFSLFSLSKVGFERIEISCYRDRYRWAHRSNYNLLFPKRSFKSRTAAVGRAPSSASSLVETR
jgi:hypothetical protein